MRCLNFNEYSDTSEDIEDLGYIDSEEDTDIVIVNYEEEYFSGQLKDLRKNEDKTANEYQVTAMA